MPRDERSTEFLPPEPLGPEPDLGAAPQGPQQPRQPQRPPTGQWQQQQQHPPSAQQPWSPQPWQPQGPWQQHPWGYASQPPQPDNGAAVAGFVTSICAAGLLVMSLGFLGFLSLVAAPFGIFYSRKGRQAVDEGRTPKHRGLAQAGFVIGIITLVLSAIATIIGIIFIVAFATDEGFREDLENNGGGFDSTRTRAALLLARLAFNLLT